jgi:hypothetical protein
MVSTVGTYLQSSFCPGKDEGTTAQGPLSAQVLPHILALRLSTNSPYNHSNYDLKGVTFYDMILNRINKMIKICYRIIIYLY